MKRNKQFRRHQKKKRVKRIIDRSKNIWKEGIEYKYISMMADTPKLCNRDCCKNPRKNKWNNNKYKLTNQELKDLENIKEQVKYIEKEKEIIK